MRGWWPPCSDDPVSSSVVTGALVAGHDHVNMEGGVIQPVSVKVNLKSCCLLHNWNVHHSVVTTILHSFLNHLFHQHLSLQRDSAMC